MKRRAELEKQFDAIEQRLHKAGEHILYAAKANEDLFETSVSAVAEALGVPEDASEPKILGMSTLNTNRFYTEAIAERDAASTFEEYIAAEKKIASLEESEDSKEEREVARDERKARKLEARLRIANAEKLLGAHPPNPIISTAKTWTESELRKEYKTIGEACKALNIEARSWKDVVIKVNQKSS